MNNNKISSLILSITIVILLINNSMGSEQSHNTAVFQSFDVQYEKSPLFVAYENDRKMPLSAHKHTFLSKISAKHKEQSSFYNLNLADINKILTNNGLPTTTYFRYKLLSNIIQALRWQLFMDAFLHVSRLLFNVLDNATYVPVEQSFFEACYNQTFLIIGTANLPNVNEALLKQYPVAYDKFGFCLQEASKFRNYEVVSTLDDVCHENEKITKASSANSYDEFNKIFDDLRIDDEEQVTTGAIPESRQKIVGYYKRKTAAIESGVIATYNLNRSMVEFWKQTYGSVKAAMLREAENITGDELKVLECGASDGFMFNSCAILSGTGQNNSSGGKSLYQRYVASIAYVSYEDLEELNSFKQLLPGWKEVAATVFLLGNNVIALKSGLGYFGNFSGSHSFLRSFVKKNKLIQFIRDTFFILDPYAPTVLHARSGGDNVNSGGHVQQITVGLTPASLVYSPLWYRLNFWSIILSFEQTGSLGPLISELRVMLKIVNDKRKKMRELNQKELPFELTKNGQLAKLQNDGLLDKFRNPEQLRPLRKFGFEPADSLDMYDPIPQRLRQFELCESLKKSIPEIKKSNIAKEMIKVENAFKNTPWHQLISASAES